MSARHPLVAEYQRRRATGAAGRQEARAGRVARGYAEWLAVARAKGTVSAAEEPFPDATRFAPARALPAAPAA